ncbi:hypothetical protein [Sphingomonas aracearum]|uniref:DUF4167 domain-containing protein n=1 Tax=Sphingomonas aracearum TaxID=2283317 RepID=A0A369VYW9_9SPHN|nr:hypothetical protein [Sphingomonas aracearum]RDE06320.1 hypothetical protein DVW87_00890 [Sphingomonas aracearum]
MPMSDEQYFLGRAQTELRMARAAGDQCAAWSHQILAAHYLDRASMSQASGVASSVPARRSVPNARQPLHRIDRAG